MARTRSVLIVGGSGFLGTHLALKLRDGYKVFATYSKHKISIPGVTCLPLDFTNRNWIKRLIYITHPDVLIYLAGKNDLKWAEDHPREAESVHIDGPAILASHADIIQPRFIYVSNPYVFDGITGNYRENETILPATKLGRVKTSGENVVRGKCLNHIIVRSSPVFGRGNGIKPTFFDVLRTSLDQNQRIEVSSQEVHSFVTPDGLCDLITKLIDSGIRNRIMHYGGLTKVTHYELARSFAKRFGYDPSLVVPKGRANGQTFDFSLNSTQAIETLKIKPLLLEESFDLIEKNLIP